MGHGLPAKHIRAFTIIQLMVSLAVFALLSGGAVLFLRNWGGVQAIESAKSRLKSQHQLIQERIFQDISAAVLVAGKTQAIFPGISTVGFSGESSPILQIFVEAFGGMTVPVSTFTGDTNTVNVVVNFPNDLDPQLKAFFERAPNVFSYFLVSSAKPVDMRTSNYFPANYDESESILNVSVSAPQGFIIEVANASTSPDGISLPTATFSNVGMRPSDLTSQSVVYFLTALKRITYIVDEDGKLFREVYYGPNRSEKEVLSNQALDFDVLYEFGTTFVTGVGLSQPATGFPTEIRNYGPDCEAGDVYYLPDGKRCPEWSDIQKIKVALSLRSDKKFSKRIQQASGDGFDPEGFLVVDSAYTVVPTHYQNIKNDASGIDVSCYPLSSHRCENSPCVQYFNKPWNGAGVPPEDWEGYGRHVESPNPSAYCRCGTNDMSQPEVFIRPETSFLSLTFGSGVVMSSIPGSGWLPWLVDWDATSDERKDQYQACGEHFGCTNQAIRDLHPGYYLACKSLTPVDAFYRTAYPHYLNNPFDGVDPGPPGGDSNFRARWQAFETMFSDFGTPNTQPITYADAATQNPSVWNRLPALSTDPSDPGFQNKIYLETSPGDSMPHFEPDASTGTKARFLACTDWKRNDHRLELFVGINVLSADNPSADTSPWAKKCGCYSYVEDHNGITSNTALPYTSVDFRRLCNSQLDTWGTYQGDNTTVYCPNTWDASQNAYKAHSASYPQGIYANWATFCPCLKHYDPVAVGSPSQNWPNSGNSDLWDFRTERSVAPPSDTNPLNSAMSSYSLTEGSHESKPAFETILSFSPGTTYTLDGTGTQCDGIYAGIAGGSSAPNLGQCTVNYFTAAPYLISTYQSTHQSYCNPLCVYDSAIRTAVRLAITGAASAADLPPQCGGTSTSESTNEPTL